MYKYAQIDSENIVTSVSELSREKIDSNLILMQTDENVDILGKVYDPSDGSFSAPEIVSVAQPAPDYGTKISRVALKLRMTATERKTIRAAAEANADVYDFMDLLSDSTHIDLTRPETVQGIQTLEAVELLGEGRADEILTTPVTEGEKYNG
jgi:hypothetical protein